MLEVFWFILNPIKTIRNNIIYPIVYDYVIVKLFYKKSFT